MRWGEVQSFTVQGQIRILNLVNDCGSSGRQIVHAPLGERGSTAAALVPGRRESGKLKPPKFRRLRA